MTTLSASRTRAYTNTNINGLLVPATTTIYAGAAVGVNEATGSPRPLQAGDKFIGFAQSSVNHIRGQEREAPLTVVDSGQVALQISGAVATDIGKDVFATDDDTFTFSSSGGSLVGVAKQLLSAGRMMVEILPPSALNGVRLAPGGTALVSGDGVVFRVTEPNDWMRQSGGVVQSAVAISTTVQVTLAMPVATTRVRVAWQPGGSAGALVGTERLYIGANEANAVAGLLSGQDTRRRLYELAPGGCVMLISNAPISTLHFSASASVLVNTHSIDATYEQVTA